ncbi:MAG: hypothetical protein KAI95_16525, partial [Bacteroidales bacterium]|nr:hypothetical protein [Bacteroidales bacterium]
SIPELRFMPYILLALTGLALLFVFLNKWQLNLVWVILLSAAAVLALYDFYLWEYDYGHNLDPSAAIKIEGMAYQPPLIGKKQIMNFLATSLPRMGSLFLALSILFGGLAAYFGIKSRRTAR